jgi:nucleoid-associated protein YgaU
MGLNAKAAMLICLGFTGGLTWLVQQVARPMVEMPSPLIVRGEPPVGVEPIIADQASPMKRPVGAVEVVGRFERPSAVEQRPADSRAADDTLALAETREPLVGSERVLLPPLHPVPVPPTVSPAAMASADTVDDVRLAPAGEVGTKWVAADTAAVADDPGQVQESPEVASTAAGSAAEPKRYRVQRNDSLTKIARREWGSVNPRLLRALLEANPGLKDDPDHIEVGEELTIPDLASVQEPRGDAARRPSVKLVSDSSAWVDSDQPAKTSEVRWYTIRKRDCLANIARRYLNDHRRWREIAELNGLRNANRIIPGMRIKLPPAVADDGNLTT